ncbi:MAG: hypothetical protein U0169_27590, partial [Polyangiaceae bacterium]
APEGADVIATNESAATTSRTGVHGMVMFGHDTVYLSHIPMFTRPHDLQLVVEATVETSDPRLPTRFGGALHTFRPRAFSLDALKEGSLTRIVGTVFRGNFEDGGRPILSDVVVRVTRVVLARELRGGIPAPVDAGSPMDAAMDASDVVVAAPNHEWLVLGDKSHASLVHLVGAAPSFDQIAAVSVDAAGLSDVALAKGVFVAPVAAPARSDITEGSTVSVTLDGLPGTIAVTKELSCLEGPDFASPCP